MDIFEEIKVKGFADEYIDPSLDLFAEIEKLKKKKMPLYWPTITRKEIFRILPIILAIALGFLSRQQKPMLILLFLPVYTSWPKQLRYYHQTKKFCYRI
jgi:hypothetical protein